VWIKASLSGTALKSATLSRNDLEERLDRARKSIVRRRDAGKGGKEEEEEEGDGGRDAGQVAWQKGVDGDSTPPSDLLPVCPFRSRDSTCRSYVETHRLGDGQVYLYAELRRTLCLFY